MKSTYKLNLVKNSESNKVYLQVMYKGGDADTSHPQMILLTDILYANIDGHSSTIEEHLEKYRTLKDLLSDPPYTPSYYEIETEYGDEIAHMFDNVPNDPQADYQFKCYLDSVILVAYDSIGNKYESYDLL